MNSANPNRFMTFYMSPADRTALATVRSETASCLHDGVSEDARWVSNHVAASGLVLGSTLCSK